MIKTNLNIYLHITYAEALKFQTVYFLKKTITVFLSKLQFLKISLKNYPFKDKMEVTG